MAEIYLNGTELSEVDKLCLKDFFDKVEKTPDVELIDTVAYRSTIEDYKFFSTWITINGVPCSCSMFISDAKDCHLSLVYINHETERKINLDYEGNAGYTAGTFLLRAKLWALRSKDTFKEQRLPKVKNDKRFSNQKRTVI